MKKQNYAMNLAMAAAVDHFHDHGDAYTSSPESSHTNDETDTNINTDERLIRFNRPDQILCLAWR